MANKDVIQLFGTVTQGVADGFAVAVINTALSASAKQGLVVKGIAYEQVTNIPPGVTADVNYEWALSRVNKVAMPNLFDNDVLYKSKLEYVIAASGAFSVDAVKYIAPVIDIVLIESAIYFMIDTNLTGVVNNSVIRLDCEIVTVTDSERISILQNSLN